MGTTNSFDSLEPFQLPQIIKSVDTPVYIYQGDMIAKNLAFLRTTLPKVLIRFAIKANSNRSILQLMAKHGAGAEVVSRGELWRALQAGIPAQDIIFSGVGKTREDLDFATTEGVDQISVESLEELVLLASLSKNANLCLRVCPDVEALTHDKITTGRSSDKFGIPVGQLSEAFAILKANPHLNFLGLATHIGSQIQFIQPYQQTFRILARLLKTLPHGFTAKRLDLGGGFFVPYQEQEKPFDWEAYTQALQEELGDFSGQLIIEPGRFLVAQAGILLTKILYIKKTPQKTFVIVDAGMNDMIRPALYGAQHQIVAVHPTQDQQTHRVDVVGPVCESSDYFAKDIYLPSNLKQGDYLVITCCGAYGASLSSTYNSRPLIAEVLVDNKQSYLIRKAISVEHLSTFETYKALV